MDLEGKILGNRYEIIKKIGSGGMATVYKARCNLLNRYVAVKILKEEFTTDEEFIKRFKTEAESAAKLSHPNIVSIYDVGQEGRIHYIVMELVEGKTLKEIILEGGALSWKWSVNVAAQIASALEVAHKNNIIHRDIKPHNVIMTDDGIAKVTDFGIAKAVSNSTITAFGTTIGSVHYFSPEHARGGFTDAKSDIYSLGVVLYELITGRVPFDSDTPVSIALMHIQDSPKPPIEIVASVPKCVNDIILKAMQKDASLRYQNARDMLADLQVALKNPELDFVEISAPASSVSSSTETVKIPTIDKNFLNKTTASHEAPKNAKKENINNKKQSTDKHSFKELFKQSKSFRACFILGIIFLICILGIIIYFNFIRAKDVSIPELVGKSKEEAYELTKKAKLNLEISEEVFDKEIQEGYIVSQDPSLPMSVKQGRTIYVKVSKGQEVVVVPDVKDKSSTEAIKTLRDAGFIVNEEHEYSTKVSKGNIIKQSIDADKEVEGGSEITIYISDGEEQKFVEMPDLVGKSEDEAKKILNDKNLLLKSPINYVQDDSKENGIVIRQNITKGDKIEEQTSISITVNKLPETVNGTVIVNLGNYKVKQETKYDEVTNEIIEQEEQAVTVKLTVNGTSVYEQSHKPSEGKISIPVSGTGTINLELYINGSSKGTQSMELTNTRTLNW